MGNYFEIRLCIRGALQSSKLNTDSEILSRKTKFAKATKGFLLIFYTLTISPDHFG